MPEPSITTENDELFTVRDAMRELNQLVSGLESGKWEKIVLMRHNRMVAVVLPLETYAAFTKET
jgi:PHD/YefM family antitoxin component YafN of YafNO toxin-antitoxin module